MIVHYTDSYILNPSHKVTVNLIGAGGTGSKVLQCLAQLNEGIMSFGHPGIHVYCWDADIVTDANVGRQLFSRSDIGLNKATCIVTRLNRFYGYEWEAIPEMYTIGSRRANITITCIDTAKGRIAINGVLTNSRENNPTHKSYYWLDFGNLKTTGQVVLGTCRSITQPKQSSHTRQPKLKNVVELFPELKTLKEEDQGPSCSLAEAINKQDLFINGTIAHHGVDILWKLFRNALITDHGLFINMETGNVRPIKIA